MPIPIVLNISLWIIFHPPSVTWHHATCVVLNDKHGHLHHFPPSLHQNPSPCCKVSSCTRQWPSFGQEIESKELNVCHDRRHSSIIAYVDESLADDGDWHWPGSSLIFQINLSKFFAYPYCVGRYSCRIKRTAASGILSSNWEDRWYSSRTRRRENRVKTEGNISRCNCFGRAVSDYLDRRFSIWHNFSRLMGWKSGLERQH